MTIPLASVITRFESEFLAQYQDRLLPSQFKALKAMQTCRGQQPVLVSGQELGFEAGDDVRQRDCRC